MDGPPAILDKHKRYAEHHVPGDVFWGIGVENETYVELLDGLEVPVEFLLTQHTRERYSVNYWTQYKPAALKTALDAWVHRHTPPPLRSLRIPLLVNGHTFTKCDPWGEHRTTYTDNPVTNPKFGGKTLLDVAEALEPAVFGPESRDAWWCFDGDTVEFMTQAFRCTTVTAVVAELLEAKARWMTALRHVLATMHCERLLKGPVDWPRQNHGFAVFLTNRRNIAVFNNGTYHINLTAPTRLAKDGTIDDWPRFLHIHCQAARLFQWLSPFLVAAFGSGDPLAQVHHGFPAGSQRLAASRYVSVGTYDTRLMPRGKLLTTPVAEMTRKPRWWLEAGSSRIRTASDTSSGRTDETHSSAYEPLNVIGYDINFNKFPNHGLEFRIFDWFGEERLGELLEVLVWMMDRGALVARDRAIPVPQDSRIWRRILGLTVWEGASTLVQSSELRAFAAVLGVPELQHRFHRSVLECYAIIRDAWRTEYGTRGPCSSRMLAVTAISEIPELVPRSLHLTHIPEETEIRPRHIQSLQPQLFRFHAEPLNLPLSVPSDPAAKGKRGLLRRLFGRLRPTKGSAE